MNTTKNLHDVSAILFFILGFIYIAFGLAFRNRFELPTIIFWMRILDIPFALVSLLYASTGFYLQANKNRTHDSILSIVVFAICIILFALVVFINLSLPSKI